MEHKSILIQILYMAISVSIAYLGRHFITLSDLKDLTSTLQNVSAAVFTLAGIWVAYSYPEAIARFTNPKKFSLIKGTEQTQRIRSLVLTIFSSAFVLVGVVLFNLLSPYIQHLFKAFDLYPYIRIAGISAINYLAFIQLQSIARIMSNNLEFIYSLMKVKAENEAHDDLSN
ncbi:hypothetical protein ACLINW_002223 [Vibrio parahaemolyticus]|uniref:hypothetical protein n=1 Tax=Vibrio parahaemolyticus TaxID=670 RepID=UPI001DB5B0F9|nr:hypothetical protein [Vibrio parahaemolyticus]EJG1723961.1 hypothetical protein [Vibrio parahaemolyticus]EJG1740294.1 hypothetical protein [Vibrio parahaemolyticus]EJG1752252.1 hypothetical protein [Vibrio parahaemolyticus]EJG1759005.1 hypothetical protein [Vibrio parahaemolyticus]UYW17070.1 hypothetical protein IF561_07700 [Vibrio parahaemolyticus]